MKLRDELSAIRDQQAQMNVTLARLTDQVEYHIKRTDILETKLEPVKAHVALVTGLAKVVISVAGFSGLLKLVLEMHK